MAEQKQEIRITLTVVLSLGKKRAKLIKANMDFENNFRLNNKLFIKTNRMNGCMFYEYLSERKSYQDKFKTKPIFKDIQGNAVAH